MKKDDDKKVKSKELKMSKQFKKMMKKLKKKGFYSDTGSLNTFIAVWYPKKENNTDYRFRMLPKIYKIVEEYFDEKHAPFVIEVLYMMDSWCHRWKYDNLIGLFVVDLATSLASGATNAKEAEQLVRDKLEIMSVAFNFQWDKDATNAVELINEVNLDYRKIYSLALRLHGMGEINPLTHFWRIDKERPEVEWVEYFNQIVEPLIKEIIAKGAWSDYFQGFEWKTPPSFTMEETKRVADKLVVNEDLDSAIVHFLIENILCYVLASDCNCYNPFWIFGSANYKKLIKRVWKYEYVKDKIDFIIETERKGEE